MFTPLNWKEIEAYASLIRSDLQGLFVDRIIVPKRDYFPDGYLKSEWAIRLTGRKQEGVLFLSLWPRRPYVLWHSGKGPLAAHQATHSSFDLALSKYLKGTRLLEVEALPQERVMLFWFTSSAHVPVPKGRETEGDAARLGLAITLIPALPEACLLTCPESAMKTPVVWKVLVRSRATPQGSFGQDFILPSGKSARIPQTLHVRPELLVRSESYFQQIEATLKQEAFLIRLQLIERRLKKTLKQAQEGLKQSQQALTEAQKEPHWQAWGDHIKATFGSQWEGESSEALNLPTEFSTVRLSSSELPRETLAEIPMDPQLSWVEQAQKYYQKAKKKQRRITEAQSRLQRFEETCLQMQQMLQLRPILPSGSFEPVSPQEWSALEKWEKQAGYLHGSTGARQDKKVTPWIGKTFLSHGGLPIWIGRTQSENLELTFKQARGNDLWMHVRGRPGAHAVIPLRSKQSASLEDLLDAAHLVIHYSGGSRWGKTEVDYTFKKYVRRIKNSTEVHYTHNKTLLIEWDAARIQRLLGATPH